MAKQKVEDVSEVTEVVETEVEDANVEIRAAFETASTEGQEEDDVKMAMIGAGATFKNVTRLFNQFMIDAGFAISKDDRDEAVANALEGHELETEAGFAAAAEAVLVAVKGATDKSASALVRAYGKKNELEVYKKPKGSGGGKTGFAKGFYDALIANPALTKDEAIAFIQGTDGQAETSENTKRHESHYLSIWQMVNTISTAG